MEQKYTCETCGKEYNILNKVAHQIFCQNKERIRSYSNIKNNAQTDNINNKNNTRAERPKSRIQHKSNIHTIFSNNNDIQKEEPKFNNIKLKNLNKPKIMLNKNDNNLNNFQNIFNNNNMNNKNIFQKNNIINIKLGENKKAQNNNNIDKIKFSISDSSKNNFCISNNIVNNNINNNIILNNKNQIQYNNIY